MHRIAYCYIHCLVRISGPVRLYGRFRVISISVSRLVHINKLPKIKKQRGGFLSAKTGYDNTGDTGTQDCEKGGCYDDS